MVMVSPIAECRIHGVRAGQIMHRSHLSHPPPPQTPQLSEALENTLRSVLLISGMLALIVIVIDVAAEPLQV